MSTVLGAGERVFVRPMVPEDRSEFIGRAMMSTELHHPWSSFPTTAEQFEEYADRFDDVSSAAYMVCRRVTAEMVGHVTVNHIIRAAYQRASLGYGVFVPHQGHGYMVEGVGLVLGDAFGRLGLHRLEAEIQPSNGKSINLVKRLGFQREGLATGLIRIGGDWKDHERWALTAEMHDEFRAGGTSDAGSSGIS